MMPIKARVVMLRVIILALLTLLWSGILIIEAFMWSDYILCGIVPFYSTVAFSVAQLLYGLLATLTTVPFWIAVSDRSGIEHGKQANKSSN